ncbi:hypothetical protein T08_8033 [Trichinella sp. T8]|nr:hypothetical protein T08_8033 [Trichinella sp. T8]
MAYGSCNRLVHKIQGVTNVLLCSMQKSSKYVDQGYAAHIHVSTTIRCLPSHLFTVNFGFIPRYVDVAVTRLLSYQATAMIHFLASVLKT